jgi:hypothetical protein
VFQTLSLGVQRHFFLLLLLVIFCHIEMQNSSVTRYNSSIKAHAVRSHYNPISSIANNDSLLLLLLDPLLRVPD